MRIAVLNPNYNFLSGPRSMHRYAEVFINKYCSDILTYEQAQVYKGDVIVQLSGRPDLFQNCPPKEFKGLKVVHLMDHVFQVNRTNEKLKENEIDYVMCYNRHDLYDDFFKYAYKEYIGKVIPVPFGFNDLRFSSKYPYLERKNKVLALGAVNPVSDPLCIADIAVYAAFYKDEPFTHKWRRMLSLNEKRFESIMDSLLPSYPKTKDFSYDIVGKYNEYKMFTSGESIMNYPSVKTFEGMACGSVLVCSDHQCYKDLGLVDKQNCLMHSQYDLNSFEEVVLWGQNNPEELARISEEGINLAKERYTPEKIADYLFTKLTEL